MVCKASVIYFLYSLYFITYFNPVKLKLVFVHLVAEGLPP